MEFNFFDTDIIDKYINNMLPEDIQKKMKEAIQENDALALEVQLQRNTIDAIREKGISDVEKSIREVHQSLKKEHFFDAVHKEIEVELANEHKQNTPIFGLSKVQWIAAAASLVLVIAVFFILKAPQNALYTSNFEYYPDNISSEISVLNSARSNDNSAKVEALVLGMQAYQDKDFKTAISILSKQLEDNQPVYNPANLQFYLGLCWMHENDVNKAIDLFEKALESSLFEYPDAANWYLGLAFVKIEDVDASIDCLQKIKSGTYLSSAKALIAEISQID